MALQRNSELLGVHLTSGPLILQAGALVRERASEVLNDLTHELLRPLDRLPWLIHEGGLDVAPAVAGALPRLLAHQLGSGVGRRRRLRRPPARGGPAPFWAWGRR